MELNDAALALGALAQASRLEIFRLLVRAPEEGICAGEISERLAVAKPTLSFHLKELSHAGLIESRRDGRSIYYEIRNERMRELMAFLTQDCCQGRPELCLPQNEASCCAASC